MSQQTAKIWILDQFTKFYLSEKLTIVINSLTEENFVTTMSNFVKENKVYAEKEILSNNPENADALIALLNSLNYTMLQQDYFTLYNQKDPVVPNIIPQNPDVNIYLGWFKADYNNFMDYYTYIFSGKADLNDDADKIKISGAYKTLDQLQDDITKLKEFLEIINKV